MIITNSKHGKENIELRPIRIFTLLPRKTLTGEWVMLHYVWRYVDDWMNNVVYGYALEYEDIPENKRLWTGPRDESVPRYPTLPEVAIDCLSPVLILSAGITIVVLLCTLV